MKVYAVTVEAIAGDRNSTQRYTLEAGDMTDAWEKARADWRRFGPGSHVTDIQETAAALKPR